MTRLNLRIGLVASVRAAAAVLLLWGAFGGAAWAAEPVARNVIFILSDDHRYDFMSFHPGAPRWLKTPNLDRMARQGAHLANAFVCTSLCSPSRATVLTGRYMHQHRIVDNQNPEPEGTVFFPSHLRQAGIATAFVGKWHMGHDSDEARPGFDYWASYKGQGEYHNPEYNINGQRRRIEGYDTDIATDLALDYLKNRDSSKRFFLYLAFKAPHYPFEPAPRHKGLYAQEPVPYPETFARTERNYRTQPRWVKQRRYSIHGVDHMETGRFDNDPVPDFEAFFRSYCEAVHGIDENLGRLMRYLDESGLSRDTLVIYMGDNGFHLGEHGFYDKRDAFETSIRVPMLVWAPGTIAGGTRVEKMVQNLDLAPTILQAMGVAAPEAARFAGRSFLPLIQGRDVPDWRDHVLYEYHWEWNFPATPTLFAIRTKRYKYVYHHGTWDIDSFHDLQLDPHERHNLIDVPDQQERIAELRSRLFAELRTSGALVQPIHPPSGERLDQRKIE